MSSLISFFPSQPVLNLERAWLAALEYWGFVLTKRNLGDRRPGILVLINDADWELEGEDEYELKDKDSILFVSTLHGG